MRSSIPTFQKLLEVAKKRDTSQSLLNEVKYSNVLIGNGLKVQAVVSQSLLNEVKYSNKELEEFFTSDNEESQSLLNEVKYSNLCM